MRLFGRRPEDKAADEAALAPEQDLSSEEAQPARRYGPPRDPDSKGRWSATPPPNWPYAREDIRTIQW
jgi:hypothetical protein